MVGELDRNGQSSGRASRLRLVSFFCLGVLTLLTRAALHYPYVVAFEPTFIEVHHVETGHLVQIIPSANIRCLFADTPPSRINAPLPTNRQMMYGNPNPGAPPHMRPPPQFPQPQPNSGQPGFRPQPGMRPPPVAYQPQQQQPLPPPGSMMPPQARFQRSQVIFTSDDGHVQFLKFPPPSSTVKRPVHTSHSSR